MDADHPAVWLELSSPEPLGLQANVEDWRRQKRPLLGEEAQAIDGLGPDAPPFSYPDNFVTRLTNEVIWFHRNTASIWPVTLEHQDLPFWRESGHDPLLDLTFGAVLQGNGLTNKTVTTLASTEPRRHFRILISPLTAQTATADEWVRRVRRQSASIQSLNLETARAAHRDWWNGFWNRSWIRVGRGSTDAGENASPRMNRSETAHDAARLVTRAYTLQRFLNACAGRGRYPIKFNGSIFTVEVPGKFDPDYRRWGGCYWFQNTRLPYWTMLKAGDFDLMRPLFEMYRQSLPLARARTQRYFQHDGAFFPETMYFWGAYANGEMGYGWDRPGEPLGRTKNRYIRYYWSGGLELLTLMLDYQEFAGERGFPSFDALPIARSVLEFYRLHYPREPGGRILFAPAQALETWWECENPMPEVAGLRSVIPRLLALPEAMTSAEDRNQWRTLFSQLPPVPHREIDGVTLLAPAEQFRTRSNMENPELYAIFPYRLFGVGKPELELARRTFAHRLFPGHAGWQQDDIQMAFLGLAGEARQAVTERFVAVKTQAAAFRFSGGPTSIGCRTRITATAV